MKSAFVVAMLACAGSAMADLNPAGNGVAGSYHGPRAVLVNQNTTGGAGIVDQNFSDFPTFSASMVDDFSTGGQTWNISRITMYYTRNSAAWGALTTGQLSFFSKGGSLPTSGNNAGNLGGIGITMTDLGTAWAVSADVSGVGALQGINGSFWIGLTPDSNFGVHGQEFHYLSSLATNGDGSAVRNAGGGFGFGTDWVSAASLQNPPGGPTDMLMLIEGEVVPTPGSLAILGLGGLVAARRRR